MKTLESENRFQAQMISSTETTLRSGPNINQTNSIEKARRFAIEETLGNSELFTGLPQEDLKEIAEFTVPKVVTKGDYLFHEEETSHGFYIVQKGAINLHRVNTSGKEQVIHVFRSGESLGVAMLASTTVCPGHARAEVDSRVLLIKRNEFLDMLQHRRELIVRVLGSMCKQCRAMLGRIEDLTLQDVETRLANWLMKRCPDPQSQRPVTIELTTTKRLLAAELGTISETLSRTLAKMRKLNLLEVNGKSITVIRPDKVAIYMDPSPCQSCESFQIQ